MNSLSTPQEFQSLTHPPCTILHRTNKREETVLFKEGKTGIICDPKKWVEGILGILDLTQNQDKLLKFCALIPSFDEAYARFGDRLYEYELEGKIERRDGRVYVL